MARVLLSHSYFYYFDQKQWKTNKPYPPLGSIYAAAILLDNYHEVYFIDNALQKSTAYFESKINELKPDYLVLYEDGFNYLTKMCLTNMRKAAFEMAEMASKLNIPVIISSSDSTDRYTLYLDNKVNYILLGEAENTLIELINSLENGTELLENIEGIVYQKKGTSFKTKPRQVLRNLDSLPLPAWDLIDIPTYKNIWLANHGYFSLNISTTRGCPYKCNWCAKPIYGNRYNSRSPEKVAEEMAMLQDKYGVDQFWITDDIFGLKPNWVQEFSEIVKSKKRKFSYKIQSRVDLMLKDNNLEAMVSSGLNEVWVGAESGSQKILDAMDKGITVEQIKQATHKVRAHNKKICFFLQFGYSGEYRNDIKETVNLLLELMPDDIGISVSYPLPGTLFHDNVKSQLGTKENWTDSNDLDMMYKGTFNPAYYKNLHKYVHQLYRYKQGLIYFRDLPRSWRKYKFQELKSIVLSFFYYLPGSFVYGILDRILQKNAT